MSRAPFPALEGWKPRELPAFIGTVGPLWTRKESSTWAYAVLAAQKHLNPAGVVHGGMLCALLDHGLSAIAWEANGRKPCVTVSLDVQFLAPAREGDFLVARGKVVRQSASLVFMGGTITRGDDAIATATAILKVTR